jgi:hypothetical protein
MNPKLFLGRGHWAKWFAPQQALAASILHRDIRMGLPDYRVQVSARYAEQICRLRESYLEPCWWDIKMDQDMQSDRRVGGCVLFVFLALCFPQYRVVFCYSLSVPRNHGNQHMSRNLIVLLHETPASAHSPPRPSYRHLDVLLVVSLEYFGPRAATQ